MKHCKTCGIEFETFTDYVNHRCFTLKEWNKMKKQYPAQALGNSVQYLNFFTQKMESYETYSAQELILSRHKVFIYGHTNKKRVGKMVEVPLKEKLKDGLKSLPSKITAKNFDKGMAMFDETLSSITGALDQLGDGLGGNKDNKTKMEKLWGKPDKHKGHDFILGDKKSHNHDFLLGDKKKSDKNMDILWGKPTKTSSNSLKIWGDEPVQRKKRKKSTRKTKDQSNVDKIWGKKK